MVDWYVTAWLQSECYIILASYFQFRMEKRIWRETQWVPKSTSMKKANCWKGDLKRCSVNSVTNTIRCLACDLILWIIQCKYIKFLFLPRGNGQRGQMGRAFGTSRGSFQPQPFCHSMIAFTFVVTGSWEKRIFEIKFCLFLFKNSCVWTVLVQILNEKLFYYISLTSIF